MYQWGKCFGLFLLLWTSHVTAQQLLLNQVIPQAQPQNPLSAPSQETPEINLPPLPEPTPWVNCLNADVWVLFDYSGSMSGFEMYSGLALKNIAGGILLGSSNTRFGAVAFNEGSYLVQPLTKDYSTAFKNITSYIKNRAEMGTDINQGLNAVANQEERSPPNQSVNDPNFKKILILISDGEDSEHEQLSIQTAQYLKQDGWWIYSIMADRVAVSTSRNNKPQNPWSEHQQHKMEFLKNISGNPISADSYYLDSILLTDLPDYFRKHFNCL